MAGDKFNLTVNSWYKTNGTTPGTSVSALTELLSALASGIAGTGAAHGVTGTDIDSSGVLTPGVEDFLNNQNYNTSKPKAYVNWILFDSLSRSFREAVPLCGQQ